MKSNAITNVGEQYRNVNAAVKSSQAAVGGGNIALPSGSEIGQDLSVANAAAGETSSELTNINLKNYEVGRENYRHAVAGLESAPSVFGTATNAEGAATSSGTAAADTANQISQASNGWVNAVSSALGGIAGNVVTGGMKNLGSGSGFFGGNAPAPAGK